MADDINEISDPFFASIGRFIMNFENVCEALRSGATFSFASDGLKHRNLSDIVTVGLTARPLLDMFRSLISEAYVLTEEDKSTLKELYNRAETLITERNRILHNQFHLLQLGQNGEDLLDGIQTIIKRKSNGLTQRQSLIIKESVDQLSDESISLERDISKFAYKLYRSTKSSLNSD